MITDFIPASNVKIVFVLEEYSDGVTVFREDYSPGSVGVSADIDAVSFHVSFGNHGFSFYAINYLGFVSDSLILSVIHLGPTVSLISWPTPDPIDFPVGLSWGAHLM
jgi:hypothetical protein